ncbi:ATP-dependent DNA helicase RecG [Ponticoccus sp. SC2-23]|uniref:ATP-dependent DNA helicase RecG n=1 Tax=Alexandriicola marinus TaxID=2081710 RepID=UPI000FDBD6B6|nr:ATP-dependent DNA helicase RecG [Alexandriicola marinus]MBM1218905.1 ATP-dependent DNA helicase RecG [Ponticoccus sp. SC6-9]MBM1224023.1 ATP-dependent DNA helicase RecG [Ponticoccus sp. SC6-15]MBM1230198.1 ATP-dependent DNA helicase RecG [Ponticoccus sp. SC6-38]MBM1232989.1 ATP-dependent DNA helicase RecG [Ponticoccus sp. SC6-45]MBM1237061.1 ATP-dependent DNA helicase RecG [Ponticoccus sp. SC6-49]MBM1242000.1 ATP-dependent DNA helicase RecG [Ponticoccus sp. SC2-64]MBM1246513.1 ATP-depende
MTARGRPEILWPLFGAMSGLDGIGPKTEATLAQAGIEKPRDLLMTLPASGIDRSRKASVLDVRAPAVATVEVTVGAHNPPARKGRPYRIMVEDSRTPFEIVYFHARGDYLTRLLPTGQKRIVSGRVELFDGVPQMAHPDHVLRPDEAGDIPEFEPVYPLHGGVTQKLMWKATANALELLPDLPEWIDPGLMAREGWPGWAEALRRAHRPEAATEIAATALPRLRLAYDEVFAHQVTLALARARVRRKRGRPTEGTGALRAMVTAALPYSPTSAQRRAVEEIAADMAGPLRMNRLLQGDVGAGKTLVALMALLIAVEAGGQGVMMAPTEILARQHLAGLAPLAAAADIRLELLTGRDKGRERAEKLAALADGRIGILVGTHAVFQKDVHFHDLRLAIVDEQHRFGVAQRMELGAKGDGVDVLVMTATPIPRSLSLAQYGDMDISVLDEKPPGRTPVTTALVSTGRMGEVVEHLRSAVAEGRQAYWVCPLVEESEVSDMTAAEERFKHLRAALGEGVVGLVHGQLPPSEKDAAMAAFARNETKVLVATTVIEVGVDVPNASIMVIERAESFGLAQLHQLRGRVGRGAAKSTCLLMYQPPLSETGQRRLEILRETEDGFRIAEEDLAMRGAGDVIGTAQSGLPRFRIADLENQAGLMALAQSDARKLLSDDPDLTSDRGAAVRTLLWLMEQDRAIQLIGVG